MEERVTTLIRRIEAIRAVSQSKEWQFLVKDIFGPLKESLTKRLVSAAREDAPNPIVLSHLSGQLKWAERYSDLNTLEAEATLELTHIRTTYGKTEKTSRSSGRTDY